MGDPGRDDRRGGAGSDGGVTDAVGLVDHETRAGILVALAARHREAPRDPTLRFSELRARVGHDDPGNFNYHLKRLTDGLVRKTGAGYRLSDVGHRFVGALLSGRFDPDADVTVSDVELPCVVCGAPAAVSYVRGTLRVECGADHEFRADVGPEVLAGRPVAEAARIALLRSLSEWRSAVEGVCPLCDGRTSVALASRAAREPSEHAVAYEATCRRCGLFLQNVVGGCALDHPAVVSLCHDHGLDVRADAWEILADHVGAPTEVADDPFRVAVRVSVGGDALVLRLDGTAAVVSVAHAGAT